jgi:nucleoside phosphorylase/CheY-like chemotaxis protein
MKNLILIVDDNPSRYADLIKVICPEVVDEKSVTFVTNVRDAIERLGENHYAILIVDMKIPLNPWESAAADGGATLLAMLDDDDDLKRPRFVIGITAADTDAPEVLNLFDRIPWRLVRENTASGAWQGQIEAFVRHAIASETISDNIVFGTDVCIMTALQSPEFDAILRCPFSWSDPLPLDSMTYVRSGQLESDGRRLSVVAAHCSHMGSTESALLAYKLIAKYRPRIVLMAGICAGHEGKVSYGDIIVGNPVWDWTSSKITVDKDGKRVIEPAPDYLSVDRDVLSRFEVLSQDKVLMSEIQRGFTGEAPNTLLKIVVAPTASGPMVVADGTTLTTIRQTQNRNTVGLEMEAYGVYCAARMATRPRPLCVSVKSVCDYADYLKNDQYQKYAAYTSAQAVYYFIKRYGSELVNLQNTNVSGGH